MTASWMEKHSRKRFAARLNPPARPLRRPSSFRRGSALILVITVLGILFVTGVAFMASMNFDARALTLAQQATRQKTGVRVIGGTSASLASKSLVNTPGAAPGASTLGTAVNLASGMGGGGGGAGQTAYVPSTLAAVELPVVHGMFAPIEPYVIDPNPAMPGDEYLAWPWYTDIDRMVNGPFDAQGHFDEGATFSYFRHIDTRNPNFSIVRYGPSAPGGLDPRPVVDADGDGIVDSLLVNLDRMNIPREQIAEIARLVNPPEGRPERAFMGLRIVPHGGMVNLAEAHPNLITNLLGAGNPYTRDWSLRPGAYSPLVEEAPLRRRFLLPGRRLPVTRLQGNPYDASDPNVPGGGHFGLELFGQGESPTGWRRYWPFKPYSVADPNDYLAWAAKMAPILGGNPNPNYDLRHLVTTISYDDLLMRPTQANFDHPAAGTGNENRDAVEVMRELSLGQGACPMIFEYVNYPHTMPNGVNNLNWCACSDTLNNPTCRLDPRKGRLKMSLPWLDEAFATGAINEAQRVALIHETFMLMLLNARGSDWGAPDPDTDRWVISEAQLEQLEFTAASLTANLLDFADEDDVPTAVAIRSMDFTKPAAVGQFLDPSFQTQVVYGIERQPFITEIAAVVAEDLATRKIDPTRSTYAVEIYNPYDATLPTPQQEQMQMTFGLRVGGGPRLVLDRIPPGHFHVVVNGDPVHLRDGLQPDQTDGAGAVVFAPGNTVQLTLEWTDGGVTTRIVVDQFQVPVTVAVKGAAPAAVERAWNTVPQILNSPVAGPWLAPIPANPADAHEITDQAPDSLGQINLTSDNFRRPVQVLLANNTPNLGPPNTGLLAPAFPTTGSLLLLMRYANRSLDDSSEFGGRYAFTSHLYDERFKIDNGRMPIYDETPAGTPARHHVHPASFYDPTTGTDPTLNIPGDVSQLPWGQLVFDYFTALPLNNGGPWSSAAASRDAAAKPRVDREGLRVHGRVDINAAPWSVLAGLPLIPMDKIPAGGSPGQIPLLRAAIRKGAGLVNPALPNPFAPNVDNVYNPNQPNLPWHVLVAEGIAATAGVSIAQSIAAYRELREIISKSGPPLLTTGNYDYDPSLGFGRGWDVLGPKLRRGTGFLTVGELANLRHPSAMPAFRTDGGVVGSGQEDYLTAVAVLVALNDWVSVRSHVYTVYGTIWGDAAATVTPQQLEAHAIRFQETFDRLDVFLGAAGPTRIGDRTVAKYRDFHGD